MKDNAAISQIITMEKAWTQNSNPDHIRGTFNLELLMAVIKIKLEQNK
jgi:hypothetical protein